LRPLLIFLLFLTATLFAGALLAFPLYLFTSLFTDTGLADSAIRATQLCGFAFCLAYLKYTCQLNLDSIGLQLPSARYLSEFSYGLLAGLLILAGLAAALLLFGIHTIRADLDSSVTSVTRLLLGALLTGLAVGLFEETLFRGALLQGLRKQAGMNKALVTISLVYAAVHFIHYQDLSTGIAITWLSAPAQFVDVYSGVITIDGLDAFLSLFMLGTLLGLIRLHTGNIIQCIGLHAGLVAGIKLFRYFTEYRPDNSYDYLVGHDHRLGWLAFVWLLTVTAGYFVYLHRKPKASP
jgi:uncharacterized protein